MSPASTPRPPEYTGSEPWTAYSAQKNAAGASWETVASSSVSSASAVSSCACSAPRRSTNPASAATAASRSGWVSWSRRTGLAAHASQRLGSTEAKSSGPPGVHDQR